MPGFLDQIREAIAQTVEQVKVLAGAKERETIDREQIEAFNLNDRAQARFGEDWSDLSQDQKATIAFNLDEEENAVVNALEQLFGGTFDVMEDNILEELEEGDLANLEEVEPAVDRAEGAALTEALSIITGTVTAELLGGTQIESHQVELSQIMSFLALEDLLGIRSQVVAEEAVLPSLQAQIDKQNRTKFVNLQDAVEYALRNKESDQGWLQGNTAPQDTVDKVGSDDPVNPNNLVEEWGIRDDQLEILERVSLDAPEIEELVESPVQFGVVPSPEETEKVLQISGLPEEAKDLFRRTIEQAPEAADLWEQRTRTGDLVTELDSLVQEGTLTVDEAMSLLPDAVDEARPALRDRFALLSSIPAGTPSQTEFETAWAFGFVDQQTFEDQLSASEFPTDQFPSVVDGIIVDEIDGDLRQAMALGLISESRYGELMDRLGLDAETQQALMAGQDLNDVAASRLEEQADPSARPVSALPGIGESRATALATIDVETIADMAGTPAGQVAEAAQVSPETAREFINLAQQATE